MVISRKDLLSAVSSAVSLLRAAGIGTSVRIETEGDSAQFHINSETLVVDLFQEEDPDAGSSGPVDSGAADTAGGESPIGADTSADPSVFALAPGATAVASADAPAIQTGPSDAPGGDPSASGAATVDLPALEAPLGGLTGTESSGDGTPAPAGDLGADAAGSGAQPAPAIDENGVAQPPTVDPAGLPGLGGGGSIKVGDIVVLNSGGPEMRVGSISDDGTLDCSWIDGSGSLVTGPFSPATVKVTGSQGQGQG